jgi:predicted nucleic acid-binding protein
LTRFVDANIFVYFFTQHPLFGHTAKGILDRIEQGEPAVTSTLVISEICWVLEAMGKQVSIKQTLETILSYNNLKVVNYDTDDLIVGAHNMATQKINFNDGVNLAIIMRLGITEVYSNDKHFSKLEGLKTSYR